MFTFWEFLLALALNVNREVELCTSRMFWLRDSALTLRFQALSDTTRENVFFFPGCFTSRKLRSRLCCVESQKKALKNANSSAASRKILPHPGAPRQRGLLEFPAVSLSYFCPALPNAHRLFDGCDLCFCACKWKKCGWMLVMGKSWYCITVFDYHPLCWTEWRLLDERFAQHMWSCFRKLLQLKLTFLQQQHGIKAHKREWSW